MKTKTASQRADLNVAVEEMTRVVRRLKAAGEPSLTLRAGALLKDMLMSKHESTLAQ